MNPVRTTRGPALGLTRRVAVVIALVVAVLALQWAWLSARSSPAPIDGQLALTSGLTGLVDQDGRPFVEAQAHHKLRLVFFGYSHCPDVCPTTLTRVARALDLLGEEASDVLPLFVTLDPERDTPALLRDYVAALDPRLTALTGPAEAVAAAAKAYRVYYAKAGDDADYLMDHSAYLYLVAGDGTTAGYAPHDTTAEQLAERLRTELAALR